MKPLNRRTVTAAASLAVAVTALPAVALANAATRRDPFERIREATKELKDAMREAYGGKVQVLCFGPHSDTDKAPGFTPTVMVAVHRRADDDPIGVFRNTALEWAADVARGRWG
jgi:hypothetical protein